jgi:hypothetical protein
MKRGGADPSTVTAPYRALGLEARAKASRSARLARGTSFILPKHCVCAVAHWGRAGGYLRRGPNLHTMDGGGVCRPENSPPSPPGGRCPAARAARPGEKRQPPRLQRRRVVAAIAASVARPLSVSACLLERPSVDCSHRTNSPPNCDLSHIRFNSLGVLFGNDDGIKPGYARERHAA